MRKNGSIFARGCTTNRKDANLQFVGAQQLMGERKKTCVRPKNAPKPVREEPTDQNRGESELTREECVREKNGQTWVEWACGQRTDSPASTTQP